MRNYGRDGMLSHANISAFIILVFFGHEKSSHAIIFFYKFGSRHANACHSLFVQLLLVFRFPSNNVQNGIVTNILLLLALKFNSTTQRCLLPKRRCCSFRKWSFEPEVVKDRRSQKSFILSRTTTVSLLETLPAQE